MRRSLAPQRRHYRWLPALCLLLGSTGIMAEYYRIGAEDGWYPYTGLREGKVQGLSVDVVQAAFAATGTAIELVVYPYSRCMHMTLKGQLPACFNTAPNEQILRDYQLPRHPLFSDDLVLWARRDSGSMLQTLEQIAGKRVAVTLGYEYGNRFDSFLPLQRVEVRQDLNGLLMLQRGRVDYSISYRGIANQLFRDNPQLAGQFEEVLNVSHNPLFLSFSRSHPQAELLRERFDQGMQRIRDNGEYRQILQRWQMPDTAAQ